MIFQGPLEYKFAQKGSSEQKVVNVFFCKLHRNKRAP